MFNVTMGICNDPVNKISKTINSQKIYECVVKNENGVNIMNPTLILKYFDIGYNYCFISDFKKYYYVKSININRNGLYEIELKEDVLMSNKEGIMNSTARLSRSADYRNFYLVDNKMPVTNKKIINTIPFRDSSGPVFDGEIHGIIATILGPQ